MHPNLAAMQSSGISGGFSRRESSGSSSRHNRSGKTPYSVVTRTLTRRLSQWRRHARCSHFRSMSPLNPPVEGYSTPLMSRLLSSKEECRPTDPSHKRHARLFRHHLAISHFDPLHRSRVHKRSLWAGAEARPEQIAIQSINHSFAITIAIYILMSRSEHYYNTLSHCQNADVIVIY